MTGPTALESRLIPTDDLECSSRNPRRGDVAAIAESLRVNGQYRPIVARQRRPGVDVLEVLAGNHTLMAARELGWSHVSAVVLEDVDDEAAARIMLADNRTAELGGYEDAELLALLTELAGSSDHLAGTGFDAGDLSELAALVEASERSWEDREVRGLPEDPVARPGDRWQLGPHTLTCGDSTDPAVWAGLEPFEVLLTDPPYGIDYDGGAGAKRAAIRGDGSGAEAAALLGDVLDQLPLAPGALVYVFTATGADGVLVQAELVARGLMRWGLVWVKDQATFGRTDYQQAHEGIAFGWTEDATDPGSELQVGSDAASPGDYWAGATHESIAYGWAPGAARRPVADRKHTTVISHARTKRNADHPTMKPPGLLAGLLEAHDLPAGTRVVDPFAGSGSLLVAAHQTGLVAHLVEAEPAYCDVICDRWRDGTGLEPRLLEREVAGA